MEATVGERAYGEGRLVSDIEEIRFLMHSEREPRLLHIVDKD